MVADAVKQYRSPRSKIPANRENNSVFRIFWPARAAVSHDIGWVRRESTGFAAEHLRSPGATPSQYLIADEEWERLLSSQPPAGRRILLMLRQGQSHGEIASEVGVHERTIRRLLRRLHPGLA